MLGLFKCRPLINVCVRIVVKQIVIVPKSSLSTLTKHKFLTLMGSYKPSINVARLKSKKSKKQAVEDSDEESNEEENADFDSFPTDKSTKLLTIKVNSLRADVVLKSSLHTARNKIEEYFYESKIRVNGKKLLKKSELVKEGDEIDIVKCVNVDNPKFLNIARVEILKVAPKGNIHSPTNVLFEQPNGLVSILLLRRDGTAGMQFPEVPEVNKGQATNPFNEQQYYQSSSAPPASITQHPHQQRGRHQQPRPLHISVRPSYDSL
ncbi:hypothetical protein FQA39_LY01331 [Lamprigera yunnana]|nr:hypothetical protein FQA39_LY01331 [Lamprigera yunnana]